MARMAEKLRAGPVLLMRAEGAGKVLARKSNYIYPRLTLGWRRFSELEAVHTDAKAW